MDSLRRLFVILLLIWTVKGLPAPKETGDTDVEDDDAVLVELARKLRPLETLESRQRRLEGPESRQRIRENLEPNHRSLEGSESKHGCGGGCSKGKARSAMSDDLEAEYLRDLRPRPIFGLLNEILETARYGYKIDRPRPHVIF